MKNHCAIFILIIIIFIGCTVHKGYFGGSKCNGKCVYITKGYSVIKRSNFLGFNSRIYNDLFNEAKDKLYRAYPLQKYEFYDNFVVDYKITYYPFFSKVNLYLTADIVCSNDVRDENEPFSKEYQYDLYSGNIISVDKIRLADSIVYIQGNKLKRGVVIDFDKKKALVITNDNKGKKEFKKIPVSCLYTIENENIEEIVGHEAGEVLEILSTSTEESPVIKTVVGLRTDKMLIETRLKNKIKYKEIKINKD